jgi:gliding motility-associated-like protein
LAAFKFELSTIEAVVAAPDPIVCLPDPVIFNNNSANGNAFFWDFGDNTFSTDINPSHLYPGPGIYTVTLVVTDTNGCFSPDSIEFIVNIGSFTGSAIQPNGPICPGDSYQLEASGGINYVWSPAQFLDNPNVFNPIATVNQTTDFMVIISDSCGIDTAYVTLPVFIGGTTISNDTSICIGNSVDLFATGGVSYTWTPDLYLDDPFSSMPVSTPDADIVYNVEIVTVNGCILNDSVAIDVYYTPPIPVLPDTIFLCFGATAEINASGGDTYLWSPNTNISSITDPTVFVNPVSDITYYCDFTNACGTTPDSVFIDIVAATITAGTDTIICPGESVNLWAQGGVSYSWSPYSSLNMNNTSLVTATPSIPTMYYVIGVDQYGCTNSDSVWVDLYPAAFIQTNPDVYAFYGDEVQLYATSTTTGPYIWDPAEFLSCVVCPDPIAIPNQNYFYTVSYSDENGCTAIDTVHIYYDPILYVPNTFTPNGDGMNPIFLAEGGNIKIFEMTIYNRWGELIFTSNDLNFGWDGTYDGNKCQDGTYVWKIKLTDFTDEEHDHVGHVNLLR